MSKNEFKNATIQYSQKINKISNNDTTSWKLLCTIILTTNNVQLKLQNATGCRPRLILFCVMCRISFISFFLLSWVRSIEKGLRREIFLFEHVWFTSDIIVYISISIHAFSTCSESKHLLRLTNSISKQKLQWYWTWR